MRKITDPSSKKSDRALIIGKSNREVNRLISHLTEYFNRVDLLSDMEQFNLLTENSHSIVVVTDTSGEVLDHDFFMHLRSRHPRAGLLCLVDLITGEAEKTMRSAGLLFLGSYEHFDDCYDSILQTALGP